MGFCIVFSLALLPASIACTTGATQGAQSPAEARVGELERENAELSKRLIEAERARDEALRRASSGAAPKTIAVASKPVSAESAAGTLPEVIADPEPKGPGVLTLAEAALPDEEEPEPRLRPVVRVHGAGDGEVTQVVADQRAAAATASEYDGALALVQKKKYEQAEAQLRRFLERNPDHPFSDNALYWLGECQYARGDYAGALESFEAVVTRYPSENKVPDALLKIALSQERLGRGGASKQAIGRLLKDHPDTAAARRVPERYLSK